MDTLRRGIVSVRAKDLKAALANVDDETIVILQGDPEGNRFWHGEGGALESVWEKEEGPTYDGCACEDCDECEEGYRYFKFGEYLDSDDFDSDEVFIIWPGYGRP